MKPSILVLFLVAGLVAGCASSPEKPVAYGAALDACVANASTREESAACRCKVSRSYDRPCDDGGAP